MDNICSLCNGLLNSVEFNLKTIKSKHSNTPLIVLIERVTGEFFSPHFNICLQCYDLINELDAIELRQIEIHRQLKKYNSISKKNTVLDIKEEVTPDDISRIEHSIINYVSDDNNLFICKDYKNNGHIELSQTLDSKSDIEKFESSNACIEKGRNENKPVQVVSDINVKKRGRRKKYPDIAKPHKCHCSKEFRTLWELKSHMNSHSDHRPFICDICGLSYKYKPAFNRHMDMHNGISPFTCVYCNKSFTQKGALVRHAPLHTGEKPYQCDACGKRFVHHTSFNIHRLSHTGQKSYKCNVCGLALLSGSHLKRHMRIHTGEKKYACDICGRRFAERYNLAAHEKLHSNPKSTLSVNPHYSTQVTEKNI